MLESGTLDCDPFLMGIIAAASHVLQLLCVLCSGALLSCRLCWGEVSQLISLPHSQRNAASWDETSDYVTSLREHSENGKRQYYF